MTSSISHEQIDQQPLSDDYDEFIRGVVLQHLVHNCHGETVDALMRSLNCSNQPATDHSQLQQSTTIHEVGPKPDFLNQQSAILKRDDSGDVEMATATAGDDHYQTLNQVKSQQNQQQTAILLQNDKQMETLAVRKQLKRLIIGGQCEAAIQLCRREFKDAVLLDVKNDQQLREQATTENFKVSFSVHCLQFIELVRQDRQQEALLYARDVLNKFGLANGAVVDELRDIVALIAYQDPQKSPVAAYLEQQYRDLVAEQLNQLLTGQPQSQLELMLKHCSMLVQFYDDRHAGSNGNGSSGNNGKKKRFPTSSGSHYQQQQQQWSLEDFWTQLAGAHDPYQQPQFAGTSTTANTTTT